MRSTISSRRRSSSIPHIALVNVVAGREVVREFVQDALQPRAVADTLEPLLNPESAERRTMIAGLDAVRASLGTPGAAARVAEMALSLASRDATCPGDATPSRRVRVARAAWHGARARARRSPGAFASRTITMCADVARRSSRSSSCSGMASCCRCSIITAIEGAVVMISEHADGEIIARIAENLGFATVRGSTSRGAARALLGAARVVEDGHDLAVTPDGPRGPAKIDRAGVGRHRAADGRAGDCARRRRRSARGD